MIKSHNTLKFTVLFGLFLCFSPNIGYSQIDSIRSKALELEFIPTLYHSPDSLFENVEYHQKLAAEKGNSSEIAKSLMRTGFIYTMKDDVDNAMVFLTMPIKLQ